LVAHLGKLRQGLGRLIDSYTDGLIEKDEFTPRLGRLRERIAATEAQVQQQRDDADVQTELRLVVGRLEEFAIQVKTGLAEADWSTRQAILRTLVKRVEVDQACVTVVFRIAPVPGPGYTNIEHSQDCRQPLGIPLREGRMRDPRHVFRYDIDRLWSQRHRPLPP
jgi:site-specific DNA recombinase